MFNNIIKKAEEIIKEGNLRRIIISDHNGDRFIEIPLLIAAVLTVAAPYVTAIGAIAGYAAKFSLEIIKKDTAEKVIDTEVNRENDPL